MLLVFSLRRLPDFASAARPPDRPYGRVARKCSLNGQHGDRESTLTFRRIIKAKAHNSEIHVHNSKAGGLILININPEGWMISWQQRLVWIRLGICFRTEENQQNLRCDGRPDAYWLLASSWQAKHGNPLTFPDVTVCATAVPTLHITSHNMTHWHNTAVVWHHVGCQFGSA